MVKDSKNQSLDPRPRGEERRREPRLTMDGACTLHLFYGAGMPIVALHGRVRNLTFRGIAVLVGLPLSVGTGRPVEVKVHGENEPPTFLAGTVAFCRKVDSGEYEIGVKIATTGCRPILVRDVVISRLVYPWFDQALLVPDKRR